MPWCIDLWIMSCRVLKRDMEVAMLDTVVAYAEAMGFAHPDRHVSTDEEERNGGKPTMRHWASRRCLRAKRRPCGLSTWEAIRLAPVT